MTAATCNQTVNDGVAHSKNPRKCAYHVTFDLDLGLRTPCMQAYLVTIVCKFGRDPAICLREEAICAKVYRQTDDGRLAIVLAHSWNELKIDPGPVTAVDSRRLSTTFLLCIIVYRPDTAWTNKKAQLTQR